GYVEQTLALQRLLQLHEAPPQIAGARAAHVLDAELELAARFVEARQRPDLDVIAIARHEVNVARPAAEHHAANLGARVLQREVPVPAGGPRDVRQFALYAHERHAAFEQACDRPIELRNGED